MRIGTFLVTYFPRAARDLSVTFASPFLTISTAMLPLRCDDEDDENIYLDKLERKALQTLFSTSIMQTNQYSIRKENKSTNNKSYRYNRIYLWDVVQSQGHCRCDLGFASQSLPLY